MTTPPIRAYALALTLVVAGMVLAPEPLLACGVAALTIVGWLDLRRTDAHPAFGTLLYSWGPAFIVGRTLTAVYAGGTSPDGTFAALVATLVAGALIMSTLGVITAVLTSFIGLIAAPFTARPRLHQENR